MANSVDPDQTAPTVCSGSTLFASILNLSVMLVNYLHYLRDTDSNKSSDFLLNPVCIMLNIYIITVLLCKYLCIVQMK